MDIVFKLTISNSHKNKITLFISTMKNNIFEFELYDYSKGVNSKVVYKKSMYIKDNMDITIPINYYFDFDDSISFIIKLNGIIIYDSIKESFSLNTDMIFKKMSHTIEIDNTYCIDILNFILVCELECISKNNKNHICFPNSCCFCGLINEITFVLDDISNKKRIDGFPECIGKINDAELTVHELIMINSGKIVYTLYGDDNDCFHFVKIQRIQDDEFISMTNLVSNIETLNDNEFDLFVMLCIKLIKNQCEVKIKTFRNGDKEFYINDNSIKHLFFFRISYCGNFLYFNQKHALKLIEHLDPNKIDI